MTTSTDTDDVESAKEWVPTHFVTADAVVFALHDHTPYVLLIRRDDTCEAFPGALALPGGHLDIGESLSECAVRELREETGIDVPLGVVAAIGTYSTPGRDPRGHYVTEAYLMLLDQMIEPVAGDDAAQAHWTPLGEALHSELAFDHNEILIDAWYRTLDLVSAAPPMDQQD